MLDKYRSKFNALSDLEEKRGLQSWYRNIAKDIRSVPRQNANRIDILVKKGIHDLKDMDIVLKQADKNLGIVPMHHHIYHMMVITHLENTTVYRKVSTFPILDITRRMRNVLKNSAAPRFRQESWMAQAKNDAQPAHFYCSPKLHKKKLYTGRPIAAQHSYVLAPLSKALAKILNNTTKNIPTIASDSKKTAAELNTFKFDKNGIFLTFDVEACYPSIPLQDALKTLESKVPILNEKNKFWLKILKLILYNNYVQYDGQIYRQMRGTAMGTPVAPPFANLYMHYKFEVVLEKYAEHILFYRRFIDDGFVIVDSVETARALIRDLNAASPLRLTFEISEITAIFLDFIISKGCRFQREKKLDLSPFFKPTNKFLYLPERSYHPAHMKLSIVKGEAVRCLRNSTDKQAWLTALHRIFKGLISRGHRGKDIQRMWRTIRWEDRDRYLYGESNQAERPDGILIVTRYHPHMKGVWKKLIRKHSVARRLHMKRRNRWNEAQQTILEEWPPKIVFKDFRKLGHCLIRASDSGKHPHPKQIA